MDNDTDLLETNRFISNRDINLQQQADYLDTDLSYRNFLKDTMDIDLEKHLDEELLKQDGDILNDESQNIIENTTFFHNVNTIYSIDSRLRNKTLNQNGYKYNVFLEKELTDLYEINLLDVFIPYNGDVSLMNQKPPAAPVYYPYPYVYMHICIVGVAESTLNNIMVPIEDTNKRQNNMLVFSKIGLSIRNDGSYVYDKIIYGSRNIEDLSLNVKSASEIVIDIKNPNGEALTSIGMATPFDDDVTNHWNITLEFKERKQSLLETNINTKHNLNTNIIQKKLT